MESLTDLMISSIVARASSSSAVPSEFLLHFSISCKISGSRNVSEKTMSYFTCKMGERYFLRDLKSIKSHLHLDIQTNICNKLEKDLPLTSVGTW